MIGGSREKIINSQLPLVDSNYMEQWEQHIEKIMNGEQVNTIETMFIRVDGTPVSVSVSVSVFYNEETSEYTIAAISRDISIKKQFEKQLEVMAFYDSLTGVGNRRLFMEHIDLVQQKAEKFSLSFAVMYFDCDHFKWVNDTYGHDVGDELLISVVQRIHACIREGDMLARLGGDEFAILLENIANTKDISIIANRMISKVQEPFNIRENTFSISASIGIAIYPEDGNNREKLLSHADYALYNAKRGGRTNTVFMYRKSNFN